MARTRPCRDCPGLHCHHGYEGREGRCAWCGGQLDAPPPSAAERASLRDMLDRWTERDRRYSRRPVRLTPAEMAAVRCVRAMEVELLAPADRPMARAALSRLAFGITEPW